MSDGLKGPWTQQEIYFRDQLTAMAKLPENAECADCNSKAPRWAVFNHGIFVCIKCSGQHRNLGAGISKVRSINLDRWRPEQFAQMCGNTLANAELMYNLPENLKKPLEEEDYQRQKWIQQKYVQRKWARKPDQAPVQGYPDKNSEQSTSQSQTPTQNIPQPQVVQNIAHPPVQLPAQQNHHQLQQQQLGPPVKYDMPRPAPPMHNHVQQQQQQPVVQQQPVQPPSNNIEDLLDLFGTAPLPPPPTQVVQQQPVQQIQQPQQQQKQQDTFDDLLQMYDQPKFIQPNQQLAQQNAQQQQKKGGFDFNAFISSNQQQTQQQTSYKPAGFDW